ncbi:hypothetical protein ABEB36_004015 [Hypothenemus hampei]|uniref:Uncharacterized protein n=1 Tax=Hypothenemus hampei TaxID=57062 RepID=A0ABD1F1X0_HYPHA
MKIISQCQNILIDMSRFTVILSLLSTALALPNKHGVVVITPAPEYIPVVDSHEIKIPIAREPSKYASVHQIYPPAPDSPLFRPEKHYVIPVVKKTHDYDSKELLLRKYYDNYIEKKTKAKTNLLKKAVDKTVDVTAKLTQYTVDFITRVAIETAAKLAKSGASHVLDKKKEKVIKVKYYDD